MFLFEDELRDLVMRQLYKGLALSEAASTALKLGSKRPVIS